MYSYEESTNRYVSMSVSTFLITVLILCIKNVISSHKQALLSDNEYFSHR